MPRRFDRLAAAVTGASGGIGAAVATGLAREGARLLLSGRSAARLQAVAEEASTSSPQVVTLAADLAAAEAASLLAERVVGDLGGLDILVHCIGTYAAGPLEETREDELERLIRVNATAPILATRVLLGQLRASRGQIVFVNSSVGMRARGGIGGYAASKHALRAFADALRDEVNADGVRVLSVYLGRTATPMQEEVYRLEGRPYHPERLIQPADVAAAILDALSLPRTAELTDLHLRPTSKG